MNDLLIHRLQHGKCFIIAELSANHNQRKDIAIDTIRAARQAGADAIKLQTYTADTITIDCRNEYFQIRQGTLWDGKVLYDLYKEAYTPWEWHEELFRVAREEGLECFSSPFDRSAVDFLESFDPPAYKIASFEINDIPLIEYVASKGRPVIISTGIATLEDIELAVQACHRMGNTQTVLLKCTSSYPAPVEEANLMNIRDMAQRFGVVTGLSDHTMGISVPVAAVAMGARVIEKHFILDRSIGGPDAAFSLNVEEFSAMVKAVREAELAIGKVTYELSEKVKSSRVFSRSLFVVEDIPSGELLSEHNVRSIRPGYGMHPRYYAEVLGRRATRDLKRGEPLQPGMFEA
ncbi:MAG TPA: pseudaminic acid synthase [Bacteroidales bacterium]|nr:pseudaminic acid synthase [Bacteroidales bacterium]HRZ76881.1 pseudaminic acid synthase [Bacteroidales bacterium]